MTRGIGAAAFAALTASAFKADMADFDRELSLAAKVGSLTGAMQTAHLYLRTGNPMAAQATLARALGETL